MSASAAGVGAVPGPVGRAGAGGMANAGVATVVTTVGATAGAPEDVGPATGAAALVATDVEASGTGVVTADVGPAACVVALVDGCAVAADTIGVAAREPGVPAGSVVVPNDPHAATSNATTVACTSWWSTRCRV